MKIMDRIHENYILDTVYYTLLFLVVSLCIFGVIFIFPERLNISGVYYLIVVGIVWIFISHLFGLVFKVEFSKKQLFGIGKDKKSISLNLLYSFILITIVGAIYYIVLKINVYMVPEQLTTITRKGMTEVPNINDFNSAFSQAMFLIGITCATILNAVGEELFIRYVTYNKLAKRNSSRKLNIKFIISASLAFALYHTLFSVRYSYLLPTVFITTFLGSVALCLIFIRTKNIIYPIAMHTLLNLNGFNLLAILLPNISKKMIGTSEIILAKEVSLYIPILIIFFNCLILAFITYIYIFVKSKIVKMSK